jgi:hypothetical protein
MLGGELVVIGIWRAAPFSFTKISEIINNRLRGEEGYRINEFISDGTPPDQLIVVCFPPTIASFRILWHTT